MADNIEYKLCSEYTDNIIWNHVHLGSILVVYPNPDLSAEEEIVHKIAEMSVKLQHIDTLNDQRKLDLQGISRQFSSLVRMVKDHQDQYENNNSSLNKKLAEYSKQGGKMWYFKDYT